MARALSSSHFGPHRLAPLAAGLSAAAVAFASTTARGDNEPVTESAPAQAPYVFSIRGLVGLGGGSDGFVASARLQGEGWLSEHFGIGGRLGATWMGSLTDSDNTQAVGLSLVTRTSGRGIYGLFSFGAGYGWGTRTTSTFLCLDSCAPPTNTSLSGATIDLDAALLFHPGPVEIGPALTLESTTWGSLLATVNLALGFAL